MEFKNIKIDKIYLWLELYVVRVNNKYYRSKRIEITVIKDSDNSPIIMEGQRLIVYPEDLSLLPDKK